MVVVSLLVATDMMTEWTAETSSCAVMGWVVAKTSSSIPSTVFKRCHISHHEEDSLGVIPKPDSGNVTVFLDSVGHGNDLHSEMLHNEHDGK